MKNEIYKSQVEFNNKEAFKINDIEKNLHRGFQQKSIIFEGKSYNDMNKIQKDILKNYRNLNGLNEENIVIKNLESNNKNEMDDKKEKVEICRIDRI